MGHIENMPGLGIQIMLSQKLKLDRDKRGRERRHAPTIYGISGTPAVTRAKPKPETQ